MSTSFVFQVPFDVLHNDPDLMQGIAGALINFFGIGRVRDMEIICNPRPGGAAAGIDVYFAVAPTSRYSTIEELKTALVEDPASVIPIQILHQYGVPVLRMTSKQFF